jgi:uncharacterized membrane protein HdeD (DUF308 family)
MAVDSSEAGIEQTSDVPLMFWVTLARGIMAITLGLTVWIQPGETRSSLIMLMGMFWLVSGLMSIRWGLSGRRARGLPLLSGVVGVLAGIAALSRRFELLEEVVSETLALTLLGIAILITGLMHIFGGFRTGGDASRRWSWLSLLLGLFEILMGASLLIEPLVQGPIAYVAISIWAMLGGLILVTDAFRLRIRARRVRTSEEGS